MGERRGRVYVDANPLIYAVEGTDEVSAPVQALLAALAGMPGTAVTSELTLGEVLVGAESRASLLHKRMYLNLLVGSGLFDLVPVSRQVLLEAARYRATVYSDAPAPPNDRRNFFPDAIHIVSAAEAECLFFVSGDTRLRLPAGMSRIAPDRTGIDALIRFLS